MSVTPSDLRERYGSVYITETTDGQIIPWKPLSIGEWLQFREAFASGFYASSVLETEIFKKCVTDQLVVKTIDKQKVGTITTVVAQILFQSGPQNTNEFNAHLDHCRGIAQQPVHQIVSIICQVFAAYKPEEVYALDYETLMLRLAQAEERLFKMGLKTEPFRLLDNNEEQEVQPKKRYDPNKLKEAFDNTRAPDQSVRSNKSKQLDQIKPKHSEKIKNNKIIISKEQMAERFASGSDIEDLPLLEHQMFKDAESIYKDYLDDIRAGKALDIKTPEERLAKREEEKRKKNKSRPSKLQQGK